MREDESTIQELPVCYLYMCEIGKKKMLSLLRRGPNVNFKVTSRMFPIVLYCMLTVTIIHTVRTQTAHSVGVV